MAEQVLVRPVITEKSTKSSEKASKYVFRVSKDANKLQIKKAVEATYNVQVEQVNTLVNVAKKKVRMTRKGSASGVKPSFKKAVVTLKKGEVIDFYGAV
jgi:large subunit ribosomal protein L23